MASLEALTPSLENVSLLNCVGNQISSITLSLQAATQPGIQRIKSSQSKSDLSLELYHRGSCWFQTSSGQCSIAHHGQWRRQRKSNVQGRDEE